MRVVLLASLVLLAFVVVPAGAVGPVGTASAVWCGPNEDRCCGEPIRLPVVKKEIPNPIVC